MKKKSILVIFLSFFLYSAANEKPFVIEKTNDYGISNELLAKKIAYNHNSDINHPHIRFCEKYQEIAVFYQIEYGIPVSIQLAQAIVESGGGKSYIAIKANNLFGMKYYKKLYKGGYFTTPSGTKWRKYKSFEDSFEDHAKFLKTFYPSALGKDWEYWVNNCRGYGEGQYWKHIREVIERYNLQRYDHIVDFAINFNRSYQI